MESLSYRSGNDIDLDVFIELYRASTLGERRPIHDRSIMRAMLENGDLTISAWDDERLVGISRTLTDFSYVAYLADLAVHADYQRRGIGKTLIQLTQDALQPTCMITLLSAPMANDYYPKLGFESHPRAWTLPPKSPI